MIRRWILTAVGVLAVPFVGLALLSLFSKKPASVGVPTTKLAPCPRKTNCVCSQDDGESGIEPISLKPGPDLVWRTLKELLRNDPTMRIAVDRPEYIHVECRTPLLRFVDDMEFVRDDKAMVVHVRSAARSGTHDMGANRRRIEAVRTEIERAATAATDRAIKEAGKTR
jgi:uncharacterized protein (DUF1499 family)